MIGKDVALLRRQGAITRYWASCGVLFLAALAWNGIVHLVLLRSARAEAARLFRADLASYAWLSLVVTAGMVCLFTWGYRRFARDGSLGEAGRFGLFFGLLAGLLVDLNQFVLYPLPLWVAASWFAFGLLEFQMYALLLAWLFPPRR